MQEFVIRTRKTVIIIRPVAAGARGIAVCALSTTSRVEVAGLEERVPIEASTIGLTELPACARDVCGVVAQQLVASRLPVQRGVARETIVRIGTHTGLTVTIARPANLYATCGCVGVITRWQRVRCRARSLDQNPVAAALDADSSTGTFVAVCSARRALGILRRSARFGNVLSSRAGFGTVAALGIFGAGARRALKLISVTNSARFEHGVRFRETVHLFPVVSWGITASLAHGGPRLAASSDLVFAVFTRHTVATLQVVCDISKRDNVLRSAAALLVRCTLRVCCS